MCGGARVSRVTGGGAVGHGGGGHRGGRTKALDGVLKDGVVCALFASLTFHTQSSRFSARSATLK